MNRHSFAEHYLKHVALGEGCNCAESILRTTGRTTLTEGGSGTMFRAFAACVAFAFDRARGRRSTIHGNVR